MLESYNWKMGLFSAAFVVVSWLMTPWMGSTGYIVANIVSMLCRCVSHASYLKKSGLQNVYDQIRPDWRWLLCTILTSGALLGDEMHSLPYTARSLCFHLFLGVLSGVGLLGLLWVFDKNLVRQSCTLFKRKAE